MDAPDLPQSLEAVAPWISKALSRGVADSKSAFHWPTLISVDASGAPQGRTVVLRAHDPQARELLFYTDQRSAKVREIEASPRVSLHIYEPKKRVQLRLTGTAALEREGARWETALGKAIASGSLDYSTEPGPGSAIEAAHDFDKGGPAEPGNFTLISFIYQETDYLHLGRERHTRCRTDWRSDPAASTWLVP